MSQNIRFVRAPWSRVHKVGWVIEESGCHIWMGTRKEDGRGRTRLGGRARGGKDVLVHRLRYEQEVGPIPDGLELDHYVCDNGHGGCCNPHHCRPVSHWENLLRGRGIASINAAKTHCVKGHEFTPTNTYRWAKGRRCRKCDSANARARAARRRATVGTK